MRPAGNARKNHASDATLGDIGGGAQGSREALTRLLSAQREDPPVDYVRVYPGPVDCTKVDDLLAALGAGGLVQGGVTIYFVCPWVLCTSPVSLPDLIKRSLSAAAQLQVGPINYVLTVSTASLYFPSYGLDGVRGPCYDGDCEFLRSLNFTFTGATRKIPRELLAKGYAHTTCDGAVTANISDRIALTLLALTFTKDGTAARDVTVASTGAYSFCHRRGYFRFAY